MLATKETSCHRHVCSRVRLRGSCCLKCKPQRPPGFFMPSMLAIKKDASCHHQVRSKGRFCGSPQLTPYPGTPPPPTPRPPDPPTRPILPHTPKPVFLGWYLEGFCMSTPPQPVRNPADEPNLSCPPKKTKKNVHWKGSNLLGPGSKRRFIMFQ